MFQLILGRSGSGKTEEIWKRLKACIFSEEAEGNCILLVPEQFSFETERALLRRLGPAASLHIKVYSFTRMAEMVRREVGGRSGTSMLSSTRVVLLAKTLRELSDNLRIYGSKRLDITRLSSILALLEELHGCAISADRLADLSEQLPSGGLKNKLYDLSLIDNGYQAQIARSYLDPMDDLLHLAEDLPQSRFFRGAHIFIDGFKSFTGQQKLVLEALMPMAADVTVSLCCDPFGDPDGSDVFADAAATAAYLDRCARQNGMPVASPLRLTTDYRHANTPALSTLESGLYAIGEPLEDEQLPVKLMTAPTVYEECRLAIRRLRRYLREGGRGRHATVVVRNLGTYAGVLEPMLQRAEIPYDIDRRDSVRIDPLTVTAVEALRCVTGNWQTESLLRLMKTGLLGFSQHSISLIENYAYIWGLRGADWKREWTANPFGFEAEFDEVAQRNLQYLNLLRRRLVKPLLRLSDTLADGCTGAAFAKALYDYLMTARVDRLVRLRVRRLTAENEYDLADRASRAWDLLMQTLDQFASAGGEETQTPSDLLALFTLAADITDMGSIPSAVDAVTVTQADRVRYSGPELVLILGANAGVFPAATECGGLLSDSERRYLVNDCQLPLTDVDSHRLLEERTFVYNAISAPSQALYVSYLTKTEDGDENEPSSLVTEMRRLLPKLPVQTARAEDAETAEELLYALAENWQQSNTLSASLHQACATFPETAKRAAMMENASRPTSQQFEDAAIAKRLFTGLQYLSPSSVETFFKCRFRYFCERGLKIRKRRKAEMDGVNFGNASHYIMERCIPRYVEQGFANVRKEDVLRDAAETLDRYVEESLGGYDGKDDRFRYLLSRVERLSGLMLWQCVRELRQSRFVPCAYELEINDPQPDGKPAIPPMTVQLSNGTSVRMIGKIDRVDMYRTGEQIYLRVIDYKTYDKSFSLNDVIHGLDMQMLLYMFALQQNGEKHFGGPITPAGVLYLPAKLPIVDGTAKDTERKQTKQMQMSGLLLDTEDVLRAMEDPLEGIFIPIHMTKSGGVSRTNLASLAQFGQLRRRGEKLLRQMAEMLQGGDVQAKPYECKQTSACQYCDYRSVCGLQEEDERNGVEALNNEKVFALVDAEEQQEGAMV